MCSLFLFFFLNVGGIWHSGIPSKTKNKKTTRTFLFSTCVIHNIYYSTNNVLKHKTNTNANTLSFLIYTLETQISTVSFAKLNNSEYDMVENKETHTKHTSQNTWKLTFTAEKEATPSPPSHPKHI